MSTIGQEVERFLHHVERTRSSRTWAQYLYVLTHMRNCLGPDTKLATLTVERAERWLHDQGWAPSTFRQARQVCAQMWDRAMGRERRACALDGTEPSIKYNPWREAECPRLTVRKPKVWTREQWAYLRDCNAGQPQALWLGCAVLAGLRQQEAANLRWEDWDEDAQLLHVWGTKTERSKRSIPIPQELWGLAEKHERTGEYCFGGYAPIGSTTAQRWTQRAMERADMRYGRDLDGTYHTGRHTFATWLAQTNVSPIVGAALVGDTVEVYVNNYVHLNPQDLAFAVHALEESL